MPTECLMTCSGYFRDGGITQQMQPRWAMAAAAAVCLRHRTWVLLWRAAPYCQGPGLSDALPVQPCGPQGQGQSLQLYLPPGRSRSLPMGSAGVLPCPRWQMRRPFRRHLLGGQGLGQAARGFLRLLSQTPAPASLLQGSSHVLRWLAVLHMLQRQWDPASSHWKPTRARHRVWRACCLARGQPHLLPF